MKRVTFSIGVPNFGPAPGRLGPGWMAEAVESAGFDGVWLTDHIVLVEGSKARYPYSGDGKFFLSAESDWYDSVTTLAYLAARTERVELGIGVLVLPLRNPLVLAKQLATIDRLSEGRVRLAVGAGWLHEEVAALGVDPATRGPRTDSAIELLRACWTGRPRPGAYGPYDVPEGVRCFPTPVSGSIPVHIGGHSRAALRRAAKLGDGWFAAGSFLTGPDPSELRAFVEKIRELRGADSEISLRLAVPPDELNSEELALRLAEYQRAGVVRFVFDFGWESEREAWRRLEDLRATQDRLGWAASIRE